MGRREGYDHEYYETHKEKRSEYNRQYYQAHKETLLPRHLAWSKAHPEQVRASVAQSQAKRKAAWLADGTCVVCGIAPAMEGRTKCEACLIKEREAERARRAANPDAYHAAVKRYHDNNIANGKCIRCGKPAAVKADGTLYKFCASCKAKDLAGQKARRAKRIEQGLCVKCSKPAVPGKRMCAACAAEHNARYYTPKIKTRVMKEIKASGIDEF